MSEKKTRIEIERDRLMHRIREALELMEVEFYEEAEDKLRFALSEADT